jgi:SAM-dependent methyltransferase
MVLKFRPFKRGRKTHWNRIYEKNSPQEVGWYQEHPEMSLKLIAATGVVVDGSIIDVGGGTSKLSGILLDRGYKDLTVLDISRSSIERAKVQFGPKNMHITWIEADVTTFNFTKKFDIWHDRAVFHFLTEPLDRERYVSSVSNALKPGGYLIISSFGLEGPRKCSGLKIVRYSPETLSNEFGDGFELLETMDEIHTTPYQIQQQFIYCRFKKQT